MVKYYDGNIFDSPAQIILHQSNCFCTMGSGIAKEIKRRYPRAYKADLMTRRGDPKKLGQFTNALAAPDQDRTIFNIYGQYNYGRDGKQYTNYKALVRGLKNVETFIRKMDMQGQIVGIPYKIGCARGGGDWSIVEGLIQTVFSSSPIEVLICKRPEDH